MIEAIIIDDEAHCIDRLSTMLAGHCEQSVQLTGAFQSVEDGITAINPLQPDLVFLDVQINDKTGF